MKNSQNCCQVKEQCDRKIITLLSWCSPEFNKKKRKKNYHNVCDIYNNILLTLEQVRSFEFELWKQILSLFRPFVMNVFIWVMHTYLKYWFLSFYLNSFRAYSTKDVHNEFLGFYFQKSNQNNRLQPYMLNQCTANI